jgi:hypothetical protein
MAGHPAQAGARRYEEAICEDSDEWASSLTSRSRIEVKRRIPIRLVAVRFIIELGALIRRDGPRAEPDDLARLGPGRGGHLDECPGFLRVGVG